MALETHRSYKMAYSDFYYINENNDVISQVVHKPIPRTDLQNGYDLGLCFLFSRKLQLTVGEYWDRMCEDYEMAVRFSKYTEFLLVSKILGAFRIRQGQLTGSNKEEEQEVAEHCRNLAKKITFEELA